MPELSVVIVATDNEQRTVLQVLVDGTSVARTVHTCASFPVAASDPVMRRVQAATPDVMLVDIPADNPAAAMRAIELLHQELPDSAVFAIGNLNQPQVIVSAMRAGAREFIERPTTTTDLLEAFVRLTTAQRRVQKEGPRGKVFTVVNAKGGSGATTVAVNLALALQSAHGHTALVDLAPLGHTALHLNLKPLFNLADATRNLHRMDSSLLESFMTRHSGGLQLLAGTNAPASIEPSTAEFVRLFDMLVTHYRYVVVDNSSPPRCRQPPGRQLVRMRAAGGLHRRGLSVERGSRATISGRNRQPRTRAAGPQPFPQGAGLQRGGCGKRCRRQIVVARPQSILRHLLGH